jgi:hypothetical protein
MTAKDFARFLADHYKASANPGERLSTGIAFSVGDYPAMARVNEGASTYSIMIDGERFGVEYNNVVRDWCWTREITPAAAVKMRLYA